MQNTTRDALITILDKQREEFVRTTRLKTFLSFTVNNFYVDYLEHCRLLKNIEKDYDRVRCARFLEFHAMLFMIDNKDAMNKLWSGMRKETLPSLGTDLQYPYRLMLKLGELAKNTFGNTDMLPIEMFNFYARNNDYGTQIPDLLRTEGSPLESRMLALQGYLIENLRLTQTPSSDYIPDALLANADYLPVLTVWLAYVFENCLESKDQDTTIRQMQSFLQYYPIPPVSSEEIIGHLGPHAVGIWRSVRGLGIPFEEGCDLVLSEVMPTPCTASLPSTTLS